MEKLHWLDRMALAIFTTPIMWGFFAFINLFTMGYIEWQEHSPHPFDSYPFTFLNLILAIFVAEMDVIIVIAQIVASNKTDWVVGRIAEIVERGEKRDELSAVMLENNLSVMRALEDMGQREAERDAELHQIIKEGHARGVVIERLLRELIERGE